MTPLRKKPVDDTPSDIDFVIIWVDGNDPEWRKEKAKYGGGTSATDDSPSRYRDWENLQYLFRSIEKFAPWVRKVHFVTAGHVPAWLDLSNKKLNFVRHEEFIPTEFLPTFNSHTIELNLHRIDGLAEKFVYFNDDMFITKPMSQNDFFVNGLPCDQLVFDRVSSSDPNDIFPHILLNNQGVINKNFNKSEVVKRLFRQIFSFKNGASSFARNVLSLPYRNISGFSTFHSVSPFLKTTFEEVWNAEPELMRHTSSHKIRHIQDVNQFLLKSWQMLSGNFYFKNIASTCGYFSTFPADLARLNDAIVNQRYSIVCVNDGNVNDFDLIKSSVAGSFHQVFPEKSSFEL